MNWIKIGDMPQSGNIVRSVSEKITSEGAKKSRKVEVGDIILSNSMSFGKPYIMGISGYIHDGWFVIREYEKNLYKDYLCQLLSSDYVQKQYRKMAAGGVVLNISSDLVNSVVVPVPVLDEQKKIADFLSLVDERIEKQRQLVDALKRYKRGLLISIFSKTNCTKHVLLGDIANIYQPATISQSEFNNGIYKVFGANGYIGYYNRFNHEKEQVTISCRGEKCGTVNLVEPCSWITGNSMVVNIDNNSDILKRYLYHCLSSQNLKYLISGSAQPQIIRSDLMRHRIPLVGLQSQSKISDIFDKLDQIIGFSEVQLLHIQKVKNGLLQQMFI